MIASFVCFGKLFLYTLYFDKKKLNKETRRHFVHLNRPYKTKWKKKSVVRLLPRQSLGTNSLNYSSSCKCKLSRIIVAQGLNVS